MTKRPVFYVLSSHWDREWHQPFQVFRYRLVQMMDKVIAGLESGDLKGPFVTDGQSIVLEDYLEIRPDRAKQVRRLLGEKRVVAGPWYVQPDEFLVSGESLIRNIEYGRQQVRDLGGEPSNAGFLCDLFGHNSQMPQILTGFGIAGGFVWRGLNHVDDHHLHWVGADGTAFPCYRFGKAGYWGYSVHVRKLGDRDLPRDKESIRNRLDTYIGNEAAVTLIPPIFIFDGADHQGWETEVYDVLLECMQDSSIGYSIQHVSLDDYLDVMLQYADDFTQESHGELREPGIHPWDVDEGTVVAGVASSRVWIKQWNAMCENQLTLWAEPISTWAHKLLGEEYPAGFLRTAWKWLLRNHPHDSIGGCSIDVVHEDMKFRFSQTEQIAVQLKQAAQKNIALHVESELLDNELRLAVFNPHPYTIDQIVQLTIPVPSDYPNFGVSQRLVLNPSFWIYDLDDERVPYQRLGRKYGQMKIRLSDIRAPHEYETDDVVIAMPMTIPAWGYTTFVVRPGEDQMPTQYPPVPDIAVSPNMLENGLLRVIVQANGTLTLTDWETGQTYDQLLMFEDSADVGDGWTFSAPSNNQLISGGKATVAILTSGQYLATLRVRQVMSIPAYYDGLSQERSEQYVDMVIESDLTLRLGAKHLEVKTRIRNTAKDHRLRVLFPTCAQTTTYLADSAFDVVERPIALAKESYSYREPEIEMKPQTTWTAVFDGQRGLAVISTGLLESAVRDTSQRAIALTLFRATGRTVFTNGEPNGQLIGDLSFEYWIKPLSGEPDRVELLRIGQQLAAPVETVAICSDEKADSLKTTTLAREYSFGEIHGDVVVTSFRMIGDAIELRLFNPKTSNSEVMLHLSVPIERVEHTSFEGTKLALLPIVGKRIYLDVMPKQIQTLRFYSKEKKE